jgi:hypothetical protein
MTKMKMFFGVIAGLVCVIISVLGYRYWKSSTVGFDCDNQILTEVSSPDGRYIASVFERNCGATTPYYRIVALRLAGTKLRGDRHEDWVFAIKERSEVQLSWRDVQHLEVLSNERDVSPHAPKSWKDVEITTKPLSP